MLTTLTGHAVRQESFCLSLQAHVPVRVVVAIPHDGLVSSDMSGMFEARRQGVLLRDMHVAPIVNDVLIACYERGVRIDVIRFLMPRAFVDVNRDSEHAWKDVQMGEIYARYHASIHHSLARSVDLYGPERVLFLDMHGFGTQPEGLPQGTYDVILGTCNRKTILHGSIDRTLAKSLRSAGFVTFLPNKKPARPQGDPLSGGHSVRLYSLKYGINAIQIELHSSLRMPTSEQKGRAFADALAGFICTHYKAKTRS